ncbi:MAG: hypothetical protein HRU19_18785 [Pseudobacteriovorax sp.]|nr:hypothetical protein [Pseudobacteriovorax sp.]
MDKLLKRVSLLIREDQHLTISQAGLNASGLVRDLLDDHFSDYKITLSVSEDTRQLYDQVVANTGGTDQELEKFFRRALGAYLEDKIAAMETLKTRLDKKGS